MDHWDCPEDSPSATVSFCLGAGARAAQGVKGLLVEEIRVFFGCGGEVGWDGMISPRSCAWFGGKGDRVIPPRSSFDVVCSVVFACGRAPNDRPGSF
jgi:hypothetical protein